MMSPAASRRASDAPVSKFLTGWLPALLVLGGGLVAWGIFSQKLEDTTRRVAGPERAINDERDRENGIFQRLSRIEAKLDGVTEVLARVPIYGVSPKTGAQ